MLQALPAFQSTLPHGSDLSGRKNRAYQHISIHAPSRERLGTRFSVLLMSTFQSTLPHGSDSLMLIATFSTYLFQSTLPHGSDLRSYRRYFGSRISIHAPSRERPAVYSIYVLDINDFNPRSLTGATLYGSFVWGAGSKFQSTLPHGSDGVQQWWHCLCTNFNPRSLTGATADNSPCR